MIIKDVNDDIHELRGCVGNTYWYALSPLGGERGMVL